MANSTVQDWINTLTPEELALELPIDFQDVSIEDAALVNQYNAYLSAGEYQTAYDYRVKNPALEKYIYDAKKMNYLQSLALNAYVFAKGEKSAINTSYDNSETGIEADNLQDAIDALWTINNSKIRVVNVAPTEVSEETIYIVASGVTKTE